MRLCCARMSEQAIAQRVIRVIAKNKKMPAEELSAATRFDDLKMDSLDALNMIFALEEEFDIDIPNEEAAKMKSIGEAIHGVEELLKAKSSLAK
jgi:acyl carrier protein